jgi:H+/gluconate symporter-like permease
LRVLLVTLYVLYPLGCILQILQTSAAQARTVDLMGVVLVAISGLAFFGVATTSLQRQAQEPEAKLDERERAERNRAAYWAHSIFSSVVVIGVLYLSLNADRLADGKPALWTPQTGEHWTAIGFGLAVAAMTLPTAVLAWIGRGDGE